MLVFDNPAATFLHNPKAAGTSIREWLYHATGQTPHDIINQDAHGIFDDQIKGFTFCCVRNPYEKVVSTYVYLKHYNIIDVKTSFESFIDNFHDDKYFPFNMSQYTYASRCDYIIRYELINEDFNVIQDMFRCYDPLLIINTSNYNKYWKEYYKSETQKKVNVLFKDDIDFLNYEF